MPNTFPARDREFISRLADDLHLSLTWDEYDDQDQNLVTWRFPGELEELVPSNGGGTPVEEDSDEEEAAWEDVDDEESQAAVDRVIAKYEKLKVAEDDKAGDFDARYELSMKEKMDEWKRNYYKVGSRKEHVGSTYQNSRRVNSRFLTMIPSKCINSYIAMSRACSG